MDTETPKADTETPIAHEKSFLIKKSPAPRGDLAATVKVIMMSGSGLFADGWDLGVTSFVLSILTHVYPESTDTKKEAAVASMTIIGVIIGQCVFGCIGDLMGRKYASIVTAFLTIAGVIASGCVTDQGYLSIASSIAICRFFAGLGIGGEYPLSAAISSEMGTNLCLDRNQMLIANSFMFRLGGVCQSLFAFILLSANAPIQATWRCALIVGAVPSIVAFLLRFLMEEDETPHPRGKRLTSYYDSGKHALYMFLPALIACSGVWMMAGFFSYGSASFSHNIAEELMGFGEDEDIVYYLKKTSLFSLIISGLKICGITFTCIVTKYGFPLMRLQTLGLLINATMLWLCCASHSVKWLGTLFFFLSVTMDGIIDCTTYLLPTLYFPKQVRATAVGLTAAMGKVGAAVGTALFPIIEVNVGLVWTLFISGGVVFAAVFISLMMPAQKEN